MFHGDVNDISKLNTNDMIQLFKEENTRIRIYGKFYMMRNCKYTVLAFKDNWDR